MEEIFLYFLENMALIIALMYLALKAREHWFANLVSSKNAHWVNGLFIGFLVFSVMYHPLVYEGMRLDLLEASLYFIALIIPTAYRFLLEGPTMLIGVFRSSILPLLIGARFHDKKAYQPSFSIIDTKRLMIGFTVFEIIKSLLMFIGTPATLLITLVLAVLASIAVFAIGLMLNDVHRHIIERKSLIYQSSHDPLTELSNIRSFHTNVREKLYKNIPLAIVMMDVDHFKNFNDTNGHLVGDTLLKTIGCLITDHARPQDFVARYGGEEFIFCYTSICNRAEAIKLAEQLHKRVEKYPFEGGTAQPDGKLTVSMGISFSTGNEPRALDELIAQADHALYQSKANGRNGITVFQETSEKAVVK